MELEYLVKEEMEELLLQPVTHAGLDMEPEAVEQVQLERVDQTLPHKLPEEMVYQVQ